MPNYYTISTVGTQIPSTPSDLAIFYPFEDELNVPILWENEREK